jgi:hypothetical protein
MIDTGLFDLNLDESRYSTHLSKLWDSPTSSKNIDRHEKGGERGSFYKDDVSSHTVNIRLAEADRL